MFGDFFRLITFSVTIAIFSFSAISLGGPSSASQEVVLNGRPLKYLGTGLREHMFLDIYSLDVYSESGACTPQRIVYDSEAKLVRFTMHRDVPLGYIWWQVKEAFKQNMPQADEDELNQLKQKIAKFLALFQSDFAEGTIVEIAYVPGKGSVVKKDGRPLGPAIPGRDFQALAWLSFFGGDAYCEQMILEQCRQAVQ